MVKIETVAKFMAVILIKTTAIIIIATIIIVSFVLWLIRVSAMRPKKLQSKF